MPLSIIDSLKQTSLFKELPEEELIWLANKFSERQLKKDEVLFKRDDRGDSLFVIDDGWLKIVTSDTRGEEVVLNQCGPGEVIGEMSLLDREPRSAGAIALSPTKLLELKADDFRSVLDEQPHLAFHIIQSISSRLRFATTYIEQAIDWSQRIAEGDYGNAIENMRSSQSFNDPDTSDEARANQLLSAFFHMVQGVQAREEELKAQVKKLTIEIDEARRKQEFDELTDTDFYKDLKQRAQQIRQQRSEDG